MWLLAFLCDKRQLQSLLYNTILCRRTGKQKQLFLKSQLVEDTVCAAMELLTFEGKTFFFI